MHFMMPPSMAAKIGAAKPESTPAPATSTTEAAPPSVTFPASLLAIHRACSYENSRYSLSGVRIEHDAVAGRLTAVACTGRILICADTENSESAGFESTLLPGEVAEAVERTMKAAPVVGDVTIEKRGLSLAVEFPNTTRSRCLIKTQAVDGRYPRWRDVTGPDASGAAKQSVTVDARLLITVLQALLKIAPVGDSEDPSVANRVSLTFTIGDSTEKIRIHRSGCDVKDGQRINAQAVVMPIARLE